MAGLLIVLKSVFVVEARILKDEAGFYSNSILMWLITDRNLNPQSKHIR
jgi:hypothetical protein